MKLKSTKIIMPAIALTLAASSAYAAYPDQPIRIVIGYAAGGTTDILARALAEQLSNELHASVIVENKTGAAGSIAATYVQNAKPDGYTLFVATVSSHGINPAIYKKLGYDPIKGFTPISMLASIPLVLVSNPKLHFKTVQDLVDAARAKPGALNYSSSGNGSPVHVAGAMFAKQANLNIVHVPYRGGALANTAVMSGEAQFSFATLPAALPQVKAGTLTALAVTTSQRSSELPNVPSLGEDKEFHGYDMNTWNALLSPANTPEPIVQKLNAAVVKVMASKRLQTRFKSEGATPESSTPQQLKTFIEAQVKKWAAANKQLDIHVD